MASADNIRQAIYRSPSGKSFTLLFDEVSRSGGKRAAIHEYPQQNGADYLDMGNIPERFPFSCYFIGDNHDKTADEFWTVLNEPVSQDSPGLLSHPIYGEIQVAPLTWSQKENLVDGIGRADFDIEFLRSINRTIFPETDISIKDAVTALVDKLNGTLSDHFVNAVIPDDATDLSTIVENKKTWLDSAKGNLSEVLATAEDIQAEADRTFRAISAKVDDLLSDPIDFFNDCVEIYNLTADVITAVDQKVEALKKTINDNIETLQDTIDQVITTSGQVASVLCDIIGALFGTNRAISSGTITNREDAVAISEDIEETTGNVLAIIEASETRVDDYILPVEIATGIKDLLQLTKESLLTQAFSLKSEKKIILEIEKTPIELCYELTGSIDDIESFMDSNDFQGSEILIVPKGRTVIYYV